MGYLALGLIFVLFRARKDQSNPKLLSEDKTGGSLVPDTVKQAKPADRLGRGVPLPLSTFLNGGSMQLSIISSDQLDQVPGPYPTLSEDSH